MSILKLNRADSKEEFAELKRERIKKSESFMELLSDVGQEMIYNRHPRVANTIKAVENEKTRPNTRERDRDWLCAVLDKAGVVSASTYCRIGNLNHTITLSQVVSICIFLGVGLKNSERLIAAAGYTLRPGNKLHDLYSFLIQESGKEAAKAPRLKRGDLKYHSLLDECNQYLAAKGITNEQSMLGVKKRKTAE